MHTLSLLFIATTLLLVGAVATVLYNRNRRSWQQGASELFAETTGVTASRSGPGTDQTPQLLEGSADPDELLNRIGEAIVEVPKLQALNWKTVSVVFDIEAGSVGNGGFAYLDDEIVPISASGAADDVRALRDAIQVPGKEGFVQMLVQIRRSDGKIKIDFEYDDPSRWRIRPANLDQMRETLRPQFAD